MWLDRQTNAVWVLLPAYSSDLEHHKRAVVGQWRALREPIDLAKNEIRQLRGAERVLFLNQFPQPLIAEKLPFAIGGFGDAVGMEHQKVAAIKRHAPLVIADVLIDSQREAGEFDFVAAAIFVEQRLGLPGVSHPQ